MSYRGHLKKVLCFAIVIAIAPGVLAIPVLADPLFVAPPHYFDSGGYEMVVEDFNNDGVLDVMPLVGRRMLLGRGDGLFDPLKSSWPYYYSGSCYTITSSDFDLDGDMDVAVGCHECMGAPYFAVLLGNGDGTFSIGGEYPLDSRLGTTFPGHIQAGDFDEDGFPDIAFAIPISSGVVIYLGNGDGSFDYSGGLITTYAPWELLVEDIDSDGHLDVVTGNLFTFSVSRFLGRGDGTFGTERLDLVWAIPWTMDGADFDLDGDQDIMVASFLPFFYPPDIPTPVSFLKNNGHGNFSWSGFRGLPNSPMDLVAADINGDEIPDMVIGEWPIYDPILPETSGVSIQLGLGDGQFKYWRSIPFPAFALGTGDLDGDGREDILSACDGVRIHLNRGDGDFPLPLEVKLSGELQDMALADIDGDGVAEALVIVKKHLLSTELVVLKGTGTGAFEAMAEYGLGLSAISLCASDLDGDGDVDVVVGEEITETLRIFINTGQGSFDKPGTRWAGGVPSRLAPGYFNADDRVDLAVLNYLDKEIHVLTGRGNGTFSAPITTTMERYPKSISIEDLNRDGFDDLVLGSGSSDKIISILMGRGNGTFTPPQVIRTPEAPESVDLAYIDGDCKIDIVISQDDEGVGILLGNGDGTFQAPLLYEISSETWPEIGSVAAADIDKDGVIDVLAAGFGKVYVFLGNGDGTLSWHSNYAVLVSATDLKTADLDRNGRPDVVAFWRGASESWLSINSFNVLMNAICIDSDGDGYAVDGGICGPLDCDDSAPGVNPSVDELCDNDRDDNCDGRIDEGCGGGGNGGCGCSVFGEQPNRTIRKINIGINGLLWALPFGYIVWLTLRKWLSLAHT